MPRRRAESILRIATVIDRVGLSDTAIYRMVYKEMFPRPVQISPGLIGWKESEITEWIATRPIVVKTPYEVYTDYNQKRRRTLRTLRTHAQV